jgi:hypothetical protein
MTITPPPYDFLLLLGPIVSKSDPSTPPYFVLQSLHIFSFPFSQHIHSRLSSLVVANILVSIPEEPLIQILPVDSIKRPTISRGIVKPKTASLPNFLLVFGKFGSSNYT